MFGLHAFMHMLFFLCFNNKKIVSKLLQKYDFSTTMQKRWHFFSWLRMFAGWDALKSYLTWGRLQTRWHLLGLLLGGYSHMSGHAWHQVCFLISESSVFYPGNSKVLVSMEPRASWDVWTYWQAPTGSEKRVKKNHYLNEIIFFNYGF